MGNIYIKHYLEHSRNGLHSSQELSISRHNGIYMIIIKKSNTKPNKMTSGKCVQDFKT